MTYLIRTEYQKPKSVEWLHALTKERADALAQVKERCAKSVKIFEDSTEEKK